MFRCSTAASFQSFSRKSSSATGRSLDLSKIEFHADDAMDLPYRDGLFDVVLSNNAFEHIPDPFQALRERRREC